MGSSMERLVAALELEQSQLLGRQGDEGRLAKVQKDLAQLYGVCVRVRVRVRVREREGECRSPSPRHSTTTLPARV